MIGDGPRGIRTQESASAKPPASLLLEAYRPIDGVVDEMVDAAGNPRPVWKNFIASLEALGSEELQKRFARADQYLRDAGVYYRVYDRAGANEREWPLAHVPLLVDEAEWAEHQHRADAARRPVRGDLRRHLWREHACRRRACCRPA